MTRRIEALCVFLRRVFSRKPAVVVDKGFAYVRLPCCPSDRYAMPLWQWSTPLWQWSTSRAFLAWTASFAASRISDRNLGRLIRGVLDAYSIPETRRNRHWAYAAAAQRLDRDIGPTAHTDPAPSLPHFDLRPARDLPQWARCREHRTPWDDLPVLRDRYRSSLPQQPGLLERFTPFGIWCKRVIQGGKP